MYSLHVSVYKSVCILIVIYINYPLYIKNMQMLKDS